MVADYCADGSNNWTTNYTADGDDTWRFQYQGADGGPHAGATFELMVTWNESHPFKAPDVQFVAQDGNKIPYHPAVTRSCLSSRVWAGRMGTKYDDWQIADDGC